MKWRKREIQNLKIKMGQADEFLKLHHQQGLLLIGNCWDVTSAKVLQDAGFQAVATSSAAVARSLGFEDGQEIPFELLFETVGRIKKVLSIPFSVDLERGYDDGSADGVARNIERLAEIGVVGVNLEDGLREEVRILRPLADFQNLIRTVNNTVNKNGLRVYINARTDGYLVNHPDAFAEAKMRVKAYEEAGAHGVFVPMAVNETEIAEIVRSVSLPVNVLALPNLPSLKKLQELGVKRVSMGTWLHRKQQAVLLETSNRVKSSGSLEGLFG